MKCSVNEKDTLQENTPFHLSCEYSNLDTIKYIIDIKCDMNLKNKNGITPFHFATKNENFSLSMVKCLIENKCVISGYHITPYLEEAVANKNINYDIVKVNN
jgi:ankyrin repeat protein